MNVSSGTGSPGQRAIKRSCVCVCVLVDIIQLQRPVNVVSHSLVSYVFLVLFVAFLFVVIEKAAVL